MFVPQSKRFQALAQRPVNQDGFVTEWPEAGIAAMESPYDPPSSLRMENGRIVEMDGKARADFDFMDAFLADHAIDLDAAEEAWPLTAGNGPGCWWISTWTKRSSTGWPGA